MKKGLKILAIMVLALMSIPCVKAEEDTTTYIFNESIEYLFKTNYQRLQILNSLCIIDFNPKIIPTEDEKKERDLL